jgi:hypothetical protein
MVNTDTNSHNRGNRETQGKFITRLPTPAVPQSSPKPATDLPTVPAWLGWR